MRVVARGLDRVEPVTKSMGVVVCGYPIISPPAASVEYQKTIVVVGVHWFGLLIHVHVFHAPTPSSLSLSQTSLPLCQPFVWGVESTVLVCHQTTAFAMGTGLLPSPSN